jgi:hypothetical protein
MPCLENEPPLTLFLTSINKEGIMVHAYNLNYEGGIDRRIVIQDWPRLKAGDPI